MLLSMPVTPFSAAVRIGHERGAARPEREAFEQLIGRVLRMPFAASCFAPGSVDTKWYNSNAGERGMRIQRIFWDLDDDPEGNVQHVAEHGISVEEVEAVLYAAQEVVASESSGRPITFGETSTGKYIAVVFDVVEDDPLAVYPVTAYETEP